MNSCHVLGELEKNEAGKWVLTRAFISGESPWHMTKYFKARYVVLAKADGKDFDEALRNVIHLYKAFVPDIAEQFPVKYPGE